jgi:hypothetical protein
MLDTIHPHNSDNTRTHARRHTHTHTHTQTHDLPAQSASSAARLQKPRAPLACARRSLLSPRGGREARPQTSYDADLLGRGAYFGRQSCAPVRPAAAAPSRAPPSLARAFAFRQRLLHWLSCSVTRAEGTTDARVLPLGCGRLCLDERHRPTTPEGAARRGRLS